MKIALKSIHSCLFFFRLNILIPSKAHDKTGFHISPPTDPFRKHGLTNPDGAAPPVLCSRGYTLYESHLPATTFTILTATEHSEHCQCMLSFQQGNRLVWDQWSRDLGSKSSFSMYYLIVLVFHISLFTVDNVLSTQSCNLIYCT